MDITGGDLRRGGEGAEVNKREERDGET